MTPAQKIIDRFGSQTSLAEALGRSQSTIQYWSKTGNIPPKWHPPIREAAIARGITLASTDFVNLEQPQMPRTAPVAKWPGTLEVGELEMPAYVLDDGRRVLSRTGAL